MKSPSIVLMCCLVAAMGCSGGDDKPSGSAGDDTLSAQGDTLPGDLRGEDQLVVPVDTNPGLDTLEISEDIQAALDTTTPDTDIAAPDVPVEPIQCLGSVYPDSGPIDPDNPVFSDAYYDQEQVSGMFAQAKADDIKAYKAYKAGHLYPELLECAFCDCGCEGPPSNHVSAVDCFKDMHGFT